MTPFDVENNSELVNSVNPIKLYEYMASGLSVVSIDWKELTNSPALLCNSRDEFVSAIRETLNCPPNTEEHQRYAAINDWQKRLEQLIEKIDGI